MWPGLFMHGGNLLGTQARYRQHATAFFCLAQRSHVKRLDDDGTRLGFANAAIEAGYGAFARSEITMCIALEFESFCGLKISVKHACSDS